MKGVIDPLMNRFIEMIQLSTKHYYFIFCHKKDTRNSKCSSLLNEKLLQSKIVLHKLLIESQNIHQTHVDTIEAFAHTITSGNNLKRRSVGDVTKVKLEKHRLIIVTHNPITMQFAKLTKYLVDKKISLLADIHFFYFSSYLQDPRKKAIIERHFYQYNFNTKHPNFYFYHISNLV